MGVRSWYVLLTRCFFPFQSGIPIDVVVGRLDARRSLLPHLTVIIPHTSHVPIFHTPCSPL